MATASDPSRRCRGYGRAILALTLEVTREIGLRRVLITCDSDNIGSRKIIEHNGGQFEELDGHAQPNISRRGSQTCAAH